MIKKITTFAAVLLLTAGLHAQMGNNDLHRHDNHGGAKAITFSASDIQFWTGTGTNQAIIILDWDDDPGSNNLALAWGVRWNGTATATDLLDTMMAYDSRFSYTLSGSLMTNMSYNDGVNNPGSSMNGWCYYLNGDWAMYAWPNQPMTDGDVIEMSSSCMWTMNSAVAATNPNPTIPEDNTISASEITYWVGDGPFEVIFAVNWPDTALAWGYRFSARSTNLQNVMNDIAAADPRLSFEYGSYGIDDILFIENGDTLRKAAYSWWEHMVNGQISSGLTQQINDGDFSRWADPVAGVVVDSTYDSTWNYWFYTRSYPQTIYPVSAPAPVDATIDPSDILYWVGEGNNELLFVVNWADTALAWGYRFDADSVQLRTVMDDIATADPRFRYHRSTFLMDAIFFVEHGDTLSITPGNWWSHLLNGTASIGLSQWMHNGDLSRWADPAAGIAVDSVYHDDWNWWEYFYVYPQTIHPVSVPYPANAVISPNEIRYWVGDGDNSLIFVVNWPGTALAWGYRFSAPSISLQSVMDDLAAADSRLQFVNGSYGIDDILFIENGDTLRKAESSWWEHTVNDAVSTGVYQQMADGDFSRWADPTAGIVVDSTYDYDWNCWMYNHAYPQSITPVNNPNEPDEGPFCGAVGTEGCTAVHFDDSRIVAWATACSVERGSSNLTDPDASPVTYGSEADAVGPASESTMDVVSLGDGGSATLTFDTPITNGDGYDFAVFENSYNDYFLELAVVEVSSDGNHFVRFPATSLTQTHTQITQQVDPTFINNLAGKYRVGYGTPFDLEELRDSANIDLNHITHVRVIDVVGSIDPRYGTYDAFGHLINDPFPTITYSAGFDLDGVAVMRATAGIDNAQASSLRLYPNPANHSVVVTFEAQPQRTAAALFDMTGRTVATFTIEAGATSINLNTSSLANGIYMFHMAGNVEKLAIRH